MTRHDGMDRQDFRARRARIAPPRVNRRTLVARGLAALAGGVAALAGRRGALAGSTVTVAPESTRAGGLVTVRGAGFKGNRSGVVAWEATGAELARIRTSKRGKFSAPVTVPAGLATGEYRIAATVSSVTKSVKVFVVGDEPTPEPGGEGLAWGVFQPNAPGDPVQLDRIVAALQSPAAPSAVPAIVMWYQAWGLDATKSFDVRLLERARDIGAVPMITWEPWNPWNAYDDRYRLQNILKGQFDGYIREWAEGLKNYGGRVLLRWGHEANGFWYPWAARWGQNQGDPADPAAAERYVRAWAYLRQRFDEVWAGAPSAVEWVWCPNIDFENAAPFASIWPGAELVDWVGLDGYNFGWDNQPAAWKGFGEIFGASLIQLAAVAPGKPVVIGETASNDDLTSDATRLKKAAWVRQTFLADIPDRHPEVRAVVWFNEDKEAKWALTPWDPAQPWSVDPWLASRQLALDAFREVVADPRWQGSLDAVGGRAGSRDRSRPRRRRRRR